MRDAGCGCGRCGMRDAGCGMGELGRLRLPAVGWFRVAVPMPSGLPHPASRIPHPPPIPHALRPPPPSATFPPHASRRRSPAPPARLHAAGDLHRHHPDPAAAGHRSCPACPANSRANGCKARSTVSTPSLPRRRNAASPKTGPTRSSGRATAPGPALPGRPAGGRTQETRPHRRAHPRAAPATNITPSCATRPWRPSPPMSGPSGPRATASRSASATKAPSGKWEAVYNPLTAQAKMNTFIAR